MNKQNKILIAVGSALGLIAIYMYYKKKNTAVANTTNDVVLKTASVDTEVVPVVTKAPIVTNPVTPVVKVTTPTPVQKTPVIPVKTPIVPVVKIAEPVVPINPIHPVTGELTPTPAPEIPVIPDLGPIVIDFSNLNPNIGSSLVNMNVTNTDVFAPYQNCHTYAEWWALKQSGATIPPDYCINTDGTTISEKDRLQNSFQSKDIKNELSPDVLSLNTFMTQGQDYTSIPGGMSPLKRSDADPYGYGGVPST